LKLVNNASCQWRFWSDDSQVNLILFSRFNQRLNISGAYLQVVGELSRAGVPWGDKNLFDPETLGKFPDQCMLPSPTAND